ncbi:MAG: NAD(P)/FAD-dependent oxidoreductase [Rhizomicrobium sp.]|jgi:phytoene dehydrogenase-like protein
MTDRPTFDAIVIGAGINGLTAAAYLAKAGLRTVVIEARPTIGGLCKTSELGKGHFVPDVAHAVYALDPRVTSDLKLTSNGLKFALRDAPLTLLAAGGEQLTLKRDVRDSARNIAVHSKADAEAWPRFRRELFALARSMRTLWWNANAKFEPSELGQRLARTGTGPWLDSWFESDALKALLACDSACLSPLDAGSSLTLVWRAAQEMCGLQAASAWPAGGPMAIVNAVRNACEKAGVEIRTNTGVTDLLVSGGRLTGVRVQSSEEIFAPTVLSSLSRRQTLLTLAHGSGLGFDERCEMERQLPPLAAAKILLALDSLPDEPEIAGVLKSRLMVVQSVENLIVAHATARAGRIPDEPLMEIVFPSIADPSLTPTGGHLASILVQPLPQDVEGGWPAAKAAFAVGVLATLNKRIPGLLDRTTGIDVLTPDVLAVRYGTAFGRVDAARLLSGWPSRIRTPIDGLFLCGAEAEPVPAVSGRAGRIAASLAITSRSET